MAPAEGSDAKIAPAITHVGGSALTSPPHPVEFDKMEKKGGQGKGTRRSEGLGERQLQSFLLEMKRGRVEERNQEAQTRSKKEGCF